MMGPVEVEEVFSDYLKVSGIKIPFRIVTNAAGQKYVKSVVTEFKINTDIDPRLFKN